MIVPPSRPDLGLIGCNGPDRRPANLPHLTRSRAHGVSRWPPGSVTIVPTRRDTLIPFVHSRTSVRRTRPSDAAEFGSSRDCAPRTPGMPRCAGSVEAKRERMYFYVHTQKHEPRNDKDWERKFPSLLRSATAGFGPASRERTGHFGVVRELTRWQDPDNWLLFGGHTS